MRRIDENQIQNDCSSDCNSCTQNYNPLLSGVSKCDREILDENKNEIYYKTGDVIFRENTYPSGLFCLNKGKVMITKTDSKGNRIVINFHKEVAFLGLADYLSNQAYKSTCIALSDSKICLIKADSVEDLISKNHQFARKLLSVIAQNFHQCNERILSITKKNMNARIAEALLKLLTTFGEDKDGFIDVYLKRSEIAQICNMSETNVIRHLTGLKNSGAIQLEAKKIMIVDKNLISKEAEAAY